MKLTLLGATGGLGQEIIRQALPAGHHVTAVVRDPTKLTPTQGLMVIQADVMDPAAITPTLEGSDAVISALGAPEAPTTVRSDGIASVLTAMTTAGVRRLIAVSASGHAAGPGDGPVTKYIAKPILARTQRHTFADMRRMEELVTASNTEWTIVRPPMLTNGRQSRYRTETNRNVRGGIRVSRANLADFILRCLENGTPLHTTVSIGQ